MYPSFSVSMCVYGGDEPAFFDAALRSIVDQTVPPSEIVLVVDGPILEAIQSVIVKWKMNLTEIAFRVIYLEQNMGHGEARRISFENCSHDLIALMDADDLSVSTRFEQQLAYLDKHPEVSVVGGQIHEFIGDPSNCVGKRVVPLTDEDIRQYMQKRCPMNQVTVLFRKTDVAEVGGYIDWYCEEDYYLWLRLALAGKQFGNVDENMVNVRVGEEMYQRRGGMRYFKSEAKLQRFMLQNHLITVPRYVINVAVRLILQVLMPNRLRGWVFQKFARE